MSEALDYDSPWKEALRLYLRSLMPLCFPAVVDEVAILCDLRILCGRLAPDILNEAESAMSNGAMTKE